MLNTLQKILKPQHINIDESTFPSYLKNVCASNRKILGVVYPTSRDELAKIIEFARLHKISLYPISTGKNYGLGSRLPQSDNNLILDLSRMNRILSFDADLGVITIEPGVTQKDIHDFLHHSQAKFMLNVTGSADDSSLIGNALERGIGHYGSRVTEVTNIDVIFGSGEF